MQNIRVLTIFLLLIGLIGSISAGACVESYSSPSYSVESQVSYSESLSISGSESQKEAEPRQDSAELELSKNPTLVLTQLLDPGNSESISIAGINPPTASFFKIRTQLYPDFFVKEYSGLGGDNLHSLYRSNFEIQPEWFLSVSSQSSKRISGWKQSNLTANSKIYPQVFLIYI